MSFCINSNGGDLSDNTEKAKRLLKKDIRSYIRNLRDCSHKTVNGSVSSLLEAWEPDKLFLTPAQYYSDCGTKETSSYRARRLRD